MQRHADNNRKSRRGRQVGGAVATLWRVRRQEGEVVQQANRTRPSDIPALALEERGDAEGSISGFHDIEGILPTKREALESLVVQFEGSRVESRYLENFRKSRPKCHTNDLQRSETKRDEPLLNAI